MHAHLSVVDDGPERSTLKKRLILFVTLSLCSTVLFGYMTLQSLTRTHTKYTLEPLLFPYALWAYYFVAQWPILTLLLVLFQFPVYAVLFAVAKKPQKMAARIVVLHAVFAITCAILYDTL